jgi:hypothetical protein
MQNRTDVINNAEWTDSPDESAASHPPGADNYLFKTIYIVSSLFIDGAAFIFNLITISYRYLSVIVGGYNPGMIVPSVDQGGQGIDYPSPYTVRDGAPAQ